VRFALLQQNYQVGDIKGNAEKIIKAVKGLNDKDIDLIITSEMALTGYPPRDLLLSNSFIEIAEDTLLELATKLKKYPPILIGTIERNVSNIGNTLFNSAFLIAKGKIESAVQKKLLPFYDVFDENRYFESSSGQQIIQFKGMRLGVTICEDIWNDDVIYENKKYMINPLDDLRQKVDILINLSSSPFAIGKQAFRETMLSKIAIRMKTPVLFVNQVGGNDELIFDGNSSFFNEKGNLKSRAKGFCEDLLIADLNDTNETQIKPEFEREEKILKALVLGLKDYIKKCGFKKALIGLSGGIDSSLTAFIAKEAIGSENILGVLMPSPYSSEGSVKDAMELAENLIIKTSTIPIKDIMQSFENSLKPIFNELPEDQTEENIQARIRGNILMAISNKFNSILLTTGNKSELAVGYCTIYGDMSGGLAVISDLPKTVVYKVSKWINKKYNNIIPEQIISKPPSAELRPNQTDQDSLPPYEILDDILQLIIEQHKSREEIIDKGFDAEIVNKIFNLVNNAEFKRHQAAPGLKITDQAFGTGWKMPISAKKR